MNNSMEAKIKKIKAIDDRMSDLEVEIQLLEEVYGGYFPEPSEQLDRMNVLNDEYWQLYQEKEAIGND